MRFSTFTINGRETPAVYRDHDGAYIDLLAAGVATSLLDLIQRFESMDSLRSLLQRPDAPLVPAGSRRLAPIPKPVRNLFCIGKNYREHAREFGTSGFDGGALGGDEIPEYPVVFSKVSGSVCATGDAIPSAGDPFGTLDYEGELAVVIGKGGREISSSNAKNHIFGFTVLNDVTARELQKVHKQWLLGKGADGFCPLGPDIVTADEVGEPAELMLRTTVNGEKRQEACVRDLIFDIPTIIETISRGITLLPGDIIATGTPAGVGIGFSPPRYLRPGDVVTIEIDRIGSLQNTVA
jgi:2-keto-4-pentenoate hydratase/2-oxohepta-3-ene-1,7-dioic acid hydratase in catechol pathway